ILNDPNPNVKRIKLLQRTYAMKTRHIVSAGLTALVALSGIGLVTAQPQAAQNVTDERVMVINSDRSRNEVEEDPRSAGIIGIEQDGVRPIWRMVLRGQEVLNMVEVGGTAMLSFNFTDVPLPM